jgi:hypothetical protein
MAVHRAGRRSGPLRSRAPGAPTRTSTAITDQAPADSDQAHCPGRRSIRSSSAARSAANPSACRHSRTLPLAAAQRVDRVGVPARRHVCALAGGFGHAHHLLHLPPSAIRAGRVARSTLVRLSAASTPVRRRDAHRAANHSALRRPSSGASVLGASSNATLAHSSRSLSNLNARRAAGRRSAKEWDVPNVEPPEPTRLGKLVWLEHCPTPSSRVRSTCRSGRKRAASRPNPPPWPS